MASNATISIENGSATLSLITDDATGDVLSWELQNNTSFTVRVDVWTSTGFSASTDFAPGVHTGKVSPGHRWKYGADLGVKYSLTTVRS